MEGAPYSSAALIICVGLYMGWSVGMPCRWGASDMCHEAVERAYRNMSAQPVPQAWAQEAAVRVLQWHRLDMTFCEVMKLVEQWTRHTSH
ncbi:hypothetical protein MKK67_00515 [Methylobacterium sp. J-072]|uniref:hypothetical protein n=1 Tax=Methylobacterium sp. J-072 TaxID=2836651 RepID=UPI001FB9F778|nr:hypothetical protein [Methylobacterium sp. J-072]MCJ2090998.1 hypothetical protein [Methylobacterium sp. J-072]